MLSQLETVDIVVLVLMLAIMPTAGIIVALRKKSAEDYFLAGRSIRWWTVAGSVFGTNISSFHLIGMLGIGYSIGFVQAHYEIVFPAILLLCFVFLASYRRLEVFTLSQYLEVRYNSTARLIYTILLVLIILVQLVGAFYVGSITLQWLFGGSSFEISYLSGLLLIGAVTCSYTIWGGMESIVITDTIQTLMMLTAGFAVAYFTLSQPEIGGFSGLLALDGAVPREAQKMHLYLPANHPNLPWTGIFTGLMLQHCFNFTTNQFLVQRVLAASSDDDARKGIIASGFLKLTIPFFSISAGVAAYYLFQARFGNTADFNSDNAFLKLVETVIPPGVGLTGMILAGLTAATFSSVDSMMNAATTLLTLDVYQKYITPNATDRQILRFGRLMIVAMVFASIGIALFTYTPDRSNNFFLKVSAQLSYFTPGIMVAFFMGVMWKRASAKAAVAALVLAPVYGLLVEWIYNDGLSQIPAVVAVFGDRLNFMHRVFLTFLLSVATLVGLSLTLYPNANFDGFNKLRVEVKAGELFRAIGLFLAIQAVFISLIFIVGLSPKAVAGWAALATFGLFFFYRDKAPALQPNGPVRAGAGPIWQDNHLWAGLLTAISVGVLYYFA
ncbi:SLC5 family protein [Spirosoma utsteinense]|uniref:SSS family solute:Na+ symporter n=1 Tax=Spirosoma utsteinense TaxID=2585773 RepID=A0ABR6WCC8_9BACT|nr:sodium/solute symporter [Spirosoma utsteinense]MBC3787827.1 SSS family solute:Na+ symporter [Spirosoma utsteinense]MBC3793615.1 SSS family solute:Na+ symporter [Spirosoma utsteinense]